MDYAAVCCRAARSRGAITATTAILSASPGRKKHACRKGCGQRHLCHSHEPSGSDDIKHCSSSQHSDHQRTGSAVFFCRKSGQICQRQIPDQIAAGHPDKNPDPGGIAGKYRNPDCAEKQIHRGADHAFLRAEHRPSQHDRKRCQGNRHLGRKRYGKRRKHSNHCGHKRTSCHLSDIHLSYPLLICRTPGTAYPAACISYPIPHKIPSTVFSEGSDPEPSEKQQPPGELLFQVSLFRICPSAESRCRSIRWKDFSRPVSGKVSVRLPMPAPVPVHRLPSFPFLLFRASFGSAYGCRYSP